MQRLTLRHGDCVEVLKGYEDGSIGAFICDPPYHISFMGKTWDAEGAGIAFSARLWDEVYRVLRPGGVVKAFSGTRTYHRMAAAMQEAGFADLRIESWNYGSGFPKSMNIGKALDKAAGAEREVLATVKTQPKFKYSGDGRLQEKWPDKDTKDITTPATEAARQWDGWGTALKPSWEPVVVGRKPE